MKPYNYFIIFGLIFFCSCQFIGKKAPDKEVLLEQELKKINWDEVDEFPSVFLCDTVLDKEQQKQCFFDNIVQNIQDRIGIDTLQLLYPEIDTIAIKVTINSDATLKFETQQPNHEVTYNIKVIDSILQNRLVDFPPVEPAIKRGIKVKSQFILPVIIKVEK